MFDILRHLLGNWISSFGFIQADRIAASRPRKRNHKKNLHDAKYRATFQAKLADAIAEKRAGFHLLLLFVLPVAFLVTCIFLLFDHSPSIILLALLFAGFFLAELRFFNKLKWLAIDAAEAALREEKEKEYKAKLDEAAEKKAAEAAAKAARDRQLAAEKEAAKKARKKAEKKAAEQAAQAQAPSSQSSSSSGNDLRLKGFRPPKL